MSFIDRIKYFMFCSLAFMGTGLNISAMNNPQTPMNPINFNYGYENPYKTPSFFVKNADEISVQTNYAVIYKYVDIPLNYRRPNEHCSICRGEFTTPDSGYDCHSTNIKCKCFLNKNKNVDCIFIPISQNVNIDSNNDLIDLYNDPNSLKLCYNCMREYLKPYLENLSKSFQRNNLFNLALCDAFEINVFRNNRRVSTLPKEFRFCNQHNKCFYCRKNVRPNSSKPIFMCVNGHLWHVECNQGNCPACNSTVVSTIKQYIDVIGIMEFIRGRKLF